MNYLILFYTQIIQNIWWITCSFIFYYPYEYYICTLSIIFILIRIFLIVLELQLKQTLTYQILQLLLNCLYTEVSLRMPMNNPFVNHTNSLMILANYYYANQEQLNNVQIVSKLGFPIYSLLRILSITFIQSNYNIIESCLIILIFLCLVVYNEIMQKIESNQNVTKQLNLSEQQNFNSQFMTFVQQDSRRQSLGPPSFKKSKTHYSQNQDKQQEISSNIPLYNKPNTLEDNYKNQLPQFNQKKIFQKKISIVSVEKTDQQLHTFFQNIINNIFSAGVVILNQHQQVTFMNNKCEKLLGQRGTDKVVESIKKIILENSLLEDDESPLAQIPPRAQAQMNKATLERIIKQHQKNQLELDIFDAFLYPQKYLNSYYQTVSPNCDYDQRSSISESVNETLIKRKDAVTYEHIINNEGNCIKKIRIVIIPTYMTSSQQDQLSQPSLQKVYNNKNFQINDVVQPIIVIKIKNITKKHKIEQMNKEKETHNSLLKSFSHELKTPLNSCQDMLVIIKDKISDKMMLEFVEIAHISILFLINQINDILDYAAMQSNTFKYRFTLFKMQELTDEIKYIYDSQLKSKKIEFQINLDERVKNLSIRSDKQRIMQVLINLLNNSSKFTPQGGKVKLSIKAIENHFIKIQVKDSGIGIGSEQLSTLRKVLTSSMGKSLHRSRIKKSLGLGLNISARIVEGLVQKNDGTLEIISKNKNKGTKIYFKIEYQMSFRDESLRNPMISEYTNKNNTYKQMMSYNEPSQLDQSKNVLRQSSENSKNFDYMSPSKKRKNIKNRSVKLMPASQTESLLEMFDNSNYNIELPISPDYFRYKSQTNSRTCQLCTQCIQVLVVDDVPFNQIALKALLQHYKIQSDQAYDGYQAIEMVKKQTQKHCKYYTLILMDIEMPGINGFQATKEILEITEDSTQIVMCSAYDTEENFREGEEVGMSEFLPKPVHQKDLERILRQFSLI